MLDANSAAALATQEPVATSDPTPAPQATPDAPSSTPAAAAQATPEPFLRIDDRTSYADKDAATKGWQSLKSERDRLAKFEETAKQYGVNDHQVIAQLFEELLQHRERQQQPAPAAGNAQNVQAAIAGDQEALAALPQDWQAHVKFLLPLLDKLGYVRKDALNPLQEQVQSLSSEQQRAEDARVSGAKQHGVSILTGVLKEANLPSDEATVTRLSNQIGNELYSQSRDQQGHLIPGSVEHRFIFGTEAERVALVKEAVGFYTNLGESYHTAKNASYASSKTAAQNQAPRSLPAQNAPATPARQGRISPEDSMARVRAILESQPD